jgi:plasmid stability protein
MPTLTVRNLDENTKAALAALAATHGRSMEAEARVILAEAVQKRAVAEAGGLGTRIRDRFAGLDWGKPTGRAQDEPQGAQLT